MIVERGEGWGLHQAESYAWLLERDDATFDAVIADPPYSSGGFTRGDRALRPNTKYRQSQARDDGAHPDFSGDNRDQLGYLAWSTLWLAQVARVLVPGAPAAVWTDWRQLPVTTDAFQAGGLTWRGIGVWTKLNSSRPQIGRFRSDAEFLVWGSAGPWRDHDAAEVLPGTWECSPVPASARIHLTEKPAPVMEQIVRIAPPGGVVLDPFAGSASTGVGCLRAGRRFVGVERDPEYFARAVERLRAEETSSTYQSRRAGQAALFGGST